MRPRIASLTAFLVLLALAAPAAADHVEFHPTLRTEQDFFHCIDPVKVQNLYAAQGQYPGWDTTAPDQSVTDGAGCGFYDNLGAGPFGTPGPPFDAIWQGTFAGNLDKITVELHRLLPDGRGGTLLNTNIPVVLTVDGTILYDGDVPMTFTASATGASERMRFSFTGLGLLTEDGDGTRQRTIRLEVSGYNETQAAWVFDTTEVPAGMTFNPETPEPNNVPVS